MKPTRSYSSILSALAASIVLFAFNGCSGNKQDRTANEELVAASKAAGIDIRTDEVFGISRGTESFMSAPTTAWVQIPATELRKGVTFAFAHFATQEPKLPPGYYTLKAFADDIRVGTVDAKVQVIDQAGKVAAELPTQIEIHSLTVPDGSRASYVTTTNPVARQLPGDRVGAWHRCSNGQCVPIWLFVPRRLD